MLQFCGILIPTVVWGSEYRTSLDHKWWTSVKSLDGPDLGRREVLKLK